MSGAVIAPLWFSLGVCLAATVAQAEPVYNGNDLARALAAATPADRAALTKKHKGVFHTFRHLRIVTIARNTPKPGLVTMRTIEPGSDLAVELVVRHALSLQLAAGLMTNDCVAVKGRLVRLDDAEPASLVVDPAVLLRKDRPTPKPTNELLNETDPTAH